MNHSTFPGRKVPKDPRVFHVSFLESVTDRFPKGQKLLPTVVKQFVIFHGNLPGLILINSHKEEKLY